MFDVSLWHLLVDWGITVVTFPRWKCFLSHTSLTASACEWEKKLESHLLREKSKELSIPVYLKPLGPSTSQLEKTSGKVIFWCFFYYSPIHFSSQHIHSSLWKELHILTTYCMQTHFWFLLFGFGHWFATLLSYPLNITFWRLFTNTVGNLVSYGMAVLGLHLFTKSPL